MFDLNAKLAEARLQARESGTKTMAQVRALQSDASSIEGRRRLKREQIEQESE
jgi:hypothetical protein